MEFKRTSKLDIVRRGSWFIAIGGFEQYGLHEHIHDVTCQIIWKRQPEMNLIALAVDQGFGGFLLKIYSIDWEFELGCRSEEGFVNTVTSSPA